MSDTRGESIRVMHPLFHEGDGGSIPTSPLQLEIGRIPVKTAIALNGEWHSRLPRFDYPPEKCIAYGAGFGGKFYAVAIWSQPTARQLNYTGRYELRRLAISADAPKNTASRILKVMRVLLRRDKPGTKLLISYQDTDVHAGTIYAASGWTAVNTSAKAGRGWNSRSPNAMQSAASKVRWEIAA